MRSRDDVQDKLRATYKNLSRNEASAVYNFGEALALANDPTIDAAPIQDFYGTVYEACRTPALQIVSAKLDRACAKPVMP